MPRPSMIIARAVLLSVLMITELRAADKPQILNAEEVSHLIEASAKQISTVQLTYTYSRWGKPARKVLLDWDVAGDRVNATMLYPPQGDHKPVLVSWGHNGDEEWEAHPEFAKEQHGTWIVTKGREGQLGTSRKLREQEFGLQFLADVISPYAYRVRSQAAALPPNYVATISQQPHKDVGRFWQIYQIVYRGQVVSEIICEMSVEDGLRIFSTTHRELGRVLKQ